jgi:hypothetical protein
VVGSPGVGAGDLSSRQRFVNLVPALIFIGTVSILILSGAPVASPRMSVLVASLARDHWLGAALGSAVGLVAALLLEPLELATVRLLEGYWGVTGPLARLATLGCWIQERRRSRLEWIRRHLKESPADREKATRDLDWFPESWPVLPTVLGNRLRAMEERAGRPYGLRAITAWPRLYYILPKDVLNHINGARNQLDTAVRLSISFGMSGLFSAGLLVTHFRWLILPAMLFVLSWVAYKVAVEGARTYAYTIYAAFDVFHLKLLQEMSIALPVDIVKEGTINADLCDVWRDRPEDADDIVYAVSDEKDHPPTS